MHHDYEEYREHKMVPLSRLDDWKISEDDPDIRGWTVMDQECNEAGDVDDLLVDTDAGRVVFCIVSYNEILGLGGEKTLVPLDMVHLDKDRKRVMFHGTEDVLKSGPRYAKDTEDFGRFLDYWQRRQTGEREREEAVAGRKHGEAAVKEREAGKVRHKINLNRASHEELEAIEGIGPVLAERILRHRETHGKFKSVDDLQNVEGISRSTIDSLRDYVTV